MFVYGVVDANPEHAATSADDAVELASELLADGANGIEISADGPEPLGEVVAAIATLGVPISIGSRDPEIIQIGLGQGATVVDPGGDAPNDDVWRAAADVGASIVVVFSSTSDGTDSIDAAIGYFEARLDDADRFGMRRRCILGVAVRPGVSGTGAADARAAHRNLGALSRFELPVLVAFIDGPGEQSDEVIELVIGQRPDVACTADPAQIRRVEQRLLG